MKRRIIIGHTDCTDLIAAETAAAPPLSPAQRDQLYLLLAPMREAMARDAAKIVNRQRRGR